MVTSIASTRPSGSSSMTASSKSLPGRSTLVRKRDEAGLDSDGVVNPTSPSKKARVTFKDEVEVKVFRGFEKSPELIREEVQRALERHAHGDDVGYQNLVGIYSADSNSLELPSSTTLRHYTVALIANAALLKRPYSELVKAMLSSDWIWRDDSYFSLFLRFLGNLVSAQNTWLGETLWVLVQMFLSSKLP